MQVIKDNLLLKFVSLIVATILFVMLNAESSTPVEVEFPVSYTVPADFVLVGHPPSNVSTTLKGPWTRYQTFRQGDMQPVVVDLSQMSEPGTIRHVVSTSDIEAPLGLQPVSIRPSEWDITIDRLVERSIPVQVAMPHRPAFGYEIVDMRVEPSEVKVVGPLSSVMNLDYVQTRTIDVRGREDDLKVDVALRNPPFPIRVNTKQVFVSVDIGEELIQHPIRDVPVKVEVDGQVIETKPSKVMLRVSGPRRLVEAMQASALDVTVSVEEELAQGLKTFEKTIELRSALPERTQLVAPIPRVVVSVP